MAVPQHQERDTLFLCRLHCEERRLAGSHHAEAAALEAARVDREQWAGASDHLHLAVGVEQPALVRNDIPASQAATVRCQQNAGSKKARGQQRETRPSPREHLNAVRIMAFQHRLHQMVSHDVLFFLRRADRGKDRAAQRTQRLLIGHHVVGGRLVRCGGSSTRRREVTGQPCEPGRGALRSGHGCESVYDECAPAAWWASNVNCNAAQCHSSVYCNNYTIGCLRKKME